MTATQAATLIQNDVKHNSFGTLKTLWRVGKTKRCFTNIDYVVTKVYLQYCQTKL